MPEVMMKMVHPSFPDRTPAKVTPQAFKNVWQGKGWEKFTEPKEGSSGSAPSGAGDPKPSSKPTS